MSAVRPSVVCERVRAQVSLELDGQLSQLERRMLVAHLERCPACEAYAHDVSAFTQQLRAAPLESPEHPIVVRRLRRASVARLQLGVAAAIAIAILGAVSQIPSERSVSEPGTVTQYPTPAELRHEMTLLERMPSKGSVSASDSFVL